MSVPGQDRQRPLPQRAVHHGILFERGTRIRVSPEMMDPILEVIEGWLGCFSTLVDDEQQLVGLALSGDRLPAEALTISDVEWRALTLARVRTVPAVASTFVGRREGLALTQRLLIERISMLARRGALERLAFLLSDVHERLDGGAPFKLPIEKRALANFLALDLAELRQAIAVLEERQIAVIRGSWVHVLDARCLHAVAGPNASASEHPEVPTADWGLAPA